MGHKGGAKVEPFLTLGDVQRPARRGWARQDELGQMAARLSQLLTLDVRGIF